MFGGKLIRKSRKTIENSYKMHAYSNHWTDTIDIDYDGELTAEVQSAIIRAFNDSDMRTKGGSSWGALRWSLSDSATRVDVANRKLIVECGEGIAD